MPTMVGVVADSYNKPASGGGSTPPVAGYVGWFDADDASSFTYSSGTIVSQWNDKSGQNKHISQSTVAKQPNRNSTKNGRSTVVFDGTDCWLRYVGTTGLNVGSVTVFVVFTETTESGGNQGLFVAYSNPNDYDNLGSLLVHSGSTGQYFQAYRYNVGGVFSGPSVPAPWGVYTAVFKPDGSILPYKDGTSGTSGSSAGTFLTATGGYLVGDRWIGSGVYGAGFPGQIAEIVVYNTVLSDTDRVAVENYLSYKWITGPPIPAPPNLISGLQLWLDASVAASFTYSSGFNVSQWNDLSGNNRHFVQSTVVNQPVRNGTINGVPGVTYQHSGDKRWLATPAFASAFTSAELFIVVDLVTENMGGILAKWGSDASNTHYPYSDNQIYEAWGTTARKTLGNPTQDLLSPHIYNVRTAPSSYVVEINGGAFYSSGTNTVGFGATLPYEMVQNVVNYGANAVICEVAVYNRVLDTNERISVLSQLATKYGITLL